MIDPEWLSMKWICLCNAIAASRGRVLTIVLCSVVMIAGPRSRTAAQPADDPNHWVNVFIGADGNGATVPGASVPFGFVSVSPDTTEGDTSGYDSKGLIIGFSHTHVSGTGGGSKYGNFRVTPTVGPVSVNNLAFHRSGEHAQPGLYETTLGTSPANKIRAMLTATRLAAFDRFIYPGNSQPNIVLDVTSAIPLGGGSDAQQPTRAEVTILDAHNISGSASFVGGWNHAPYTIYFFATFDRAMVRSGTWKASLSGAVLQPGETHLKDADLQASYQNRMGMFATFAAGGTPQVQMKLGVSMVSEAKARQNLYDQLADWDFDKTAQAAAGQWRAVLNLIQVEGGDANQKAIFYSSLYRSHQMPHDLSGDNGWWQSSEPHYEDFYTLWDTFRTLQPLFTLIEPERERDMIRSLLDTYRHTGWLPDGRVAGVNGLVQGGSNADVVLADALVKDLPGVDYGLAYEAALNDGEHQSPDPLSAGRDLTDYLALGYMSLNQPRSASRTLEYSYDDYAIAEIASELGHRDVAHRYLQRSENWNNIWDAEKQCVRPRYANGSWLESFDCDREYPDHTTAWWDAPFYEGSSSQYSTFVPQNIPGLIQKLGGDQKFVQWLDRLFDLNLYTQANEPDILAPYLYGYAGRHDRVCERVRQILARQYRNQRSGLPGNDDAGTMSSWYVWSAIGLFPNAGQPYYLIGSPVFNRTTIHLGGNRFVIEALHNSPRNLYVQSARLNGRKLDRCWLSHEEVAKGGVLTLFMGTHPSRWSRGASVPPRMDAIH